ncbi:NDP-sugar synthase [Methanothermococcus sp. SCGC AD-155-C09]|nr:NDP-sugar synthase [Methanothermococcus sp. SCGC AD-155-C09]
MKVIIMAGGYATRLWPLTKDNPKPLLPVGDKLIIDYILEKMKELDLEIYISTNRFFASHFKEWARDKNITILVEETLHEGEKLGTIGALDEVVKKLGLDDYIIIAGDNLFSFNLKDFLNKYNGKTLIAVYDVGDFELAKRYGVVLLEDERIVDFEEKPVKPKSTWASTGVYIFPKEIMDLIPEYLNEDSKDSPGYFVQWLLSKGIEIYAYRFDDYWYDVGSSDSYLEAMKTLLKESHIEEIQISPYSKIIHPVVIKKNARILGRSIIGPYAYIGEGSIIENSDISDSIIFKNTVIRNSTIWRSTIDKKCEIRNLELKKSLVGGHAKIQRGD